MQYPQTHAPRARLESRIRGAEIERRCCVYYIMHYNNPYCMVPVPRINNPSYSVQYQ